MKKFRQTWSRRHFVTTAFGAGASVALNPISAWASYNLDPRVARIVAKSISVDTHNHVDVPLVSSELPGSKLDLGGEIKKSGLTAICMTFAVDYQQIHNPGEAYDRFTNGLHAMDGVLQSNNMKRSLNLEEIRDAFEKEDPTVIQSVEGCHFLEGKLDRVEEAYNRGLRHLGLLHDSDASVPLGDVYTNPPKYGGLTEFGASVIRECNRLGILVDLAHASNETLNAALKIASRPVVISHTGLDTQLGQNPQLAKMMRPRLISKEQARIVADAGGIIGVWTHLSDTPLEYAQNIKAMVDVMGIDHVCIGTDTKMTPSNRSFPGASHSQDNDQNRPRIGERTNLVWEGQTLGFYYIVVDALLKVNFTEDEIAKICGGNYCRVFDASTNGHRSS
ncbi:MAG TPA: membrane dipeptidase [Puia sp.]|nr:membrane dipeptidase [Puia sp.]